MKRDMQLIRQILLYIEAQQERFHYRTIVLEEYRSDEIIYHARLLVEGGYVDSLSGDLVIGLTWAGHDLLDAIRQPQILRKVLDTLQRTGMSATTEIICEMATEAIRQTLGLGGKS